MKLKPFQTLAACVLFLCMIALLNQCSSPYLHVEDYPSAYAILKDTVKVERATTIAFPFRLQPVNMKGWQFYNCSLWKSNKGMRVHLPGGCPERWLKLPDFLYYETPRFFN